MEKKSLKATDFIVVLSFLTILCIVISSIVCVIAINRIENENNEVVNQVIENTITENVISKNEITEEVISKDTNINNDNETNNEEPIVDEIEEDTPDQSNNEPEDKNNIEETIEEAQDTKQVLITSELLSEANQNKSRFSSSIQTVLNYTNQYRGEANDNEENGVSDRSMLVLDSELTTAACVRALEMAYSGTFSHERPDGRNCFSVLSDLGISSMARAENISEYYSAESTSNAWKNSSVHYSNMINPRFTKIGVGVAEYEGSYFWVQIFTD